MLFFMVHWKSIFEHEYLSLFFLWLFSILIRGYAYGISNHTFYLPQIFKHMDPSLYPLDLTFHYPVDNSFFFPLMGYLARFFSLEGLFFVTYLLFSFLFVLAIYRLTVFLFRQKMAGYLAVLLLIVVKPTLGTEQTFRMMTFPITLALPILLFSLRYFLEHRFLPAFLLLGLAFNLHGLSSSYLLALYLLSFVFSFTSIPKRSYFTGLLLFALSITPLLLLSGETTSMSFLGADADWYTFLRSIDKSHAFPLSWSLSHYRITLPLLVLGALVAFYLFKRNYLSSKQVVQRRVLTLLPGFLLLFFGGFFFAEIYPLEFVIIMQLLRSSVFLVILCLLYTAYFIYILLQRKAFFSKLFALLLFSSLFFYDDVLLILLLPCLLFLLLFERSFVQYSLSYLALVTLIFMFFSSTSLVARSFNHFALNLLLFGFLLLLFFICCRTFLRMKDYTFLLGVFIFLIFATGISIATDSSFTNHLQFPKVIPNTPRLHMEQWIAGNTPSTAYFLIPLYLSDFRLYAQRSVFFDYISTGPIYFSKSFATEWKHRMDLLHIPSFHLARQDLDILHQALTVAELANLRDTYGITHAVFKQGKQLDYPLVYENEEFVVYSLSKES